MDSNYDTGEQRQCWRQGMILRTGHKTKYKWHYLEEKGELLHLNAKYSLGQLGFSFRQLQQTFGQQPAQDWEIMVVCGL